MKIIDDGHTFELNSYDGGEPQQLIFVKRNFPPSKYPGNITSYPGTNLQEVLRALVSRLDYLQNQAPACENTEAINHLEEAIFLLEKRAHAKHNSDISDVPRYKVLEAKPCFKCGHVLCTWCT